LTSITGFDESVPRPEPVGRSVASRLTLNSSARSSNLLSPVVVCLGSSVARRLVGDQELGQHRSSAHHLGSGGLDDHPVFARAHARRAEHPTTRVDDAHPAHAHGVVALVVAQHGNVDADQFGGVVDRRSLGSGDRMSVDLQTDGPDRGCHLLHQGDGS
jgi:hypothetical protein